MKNKYSIKVIFIVLLSILSIFFVGFKLTTNKTPNELYAVYLEGKKIGVVKSKDEFNKYINKQEETLKTKYQVDNIYTPKGVEIKKIVTYSKKYNSNKEIYDLLVKQQNFTIKGVVIKIEKEQTESEEGQVDFSANNTNNTTDKNTKKEYITINVVNKKTFDDSISNIIKAFVDEEEYEAYMESTQKEIVDTGELIENVYIKEKVTYKEGYISTDEEIFTDASELTKYLMYVALGFCLFASLMLMNFIATSISYKKREIGILRALGSKKSDVFGIFFNESLIIAFINFVLASIGCMVTTGLLNAMLRKEYELKITIFNFGIRQLALILVISVAVAFISSLIPVSKIAKKQPIDAINNR